MLVRTQLIMNKECHCWFYWYACCVKLVLSTSLTYLSWLNWVE